MHWLEGFPLSPTARFAAAGELLVPRFAAPDEALYLRHGRVVAGLLMRGAVRHRLALFEGPCWLDASVALLGETATCDLVADAPVELWSFPASALRDWHATLPEAAAMLLTDMARAQRRQTDALLALLLQGAEARCAQWLLQHSRRSDDGRVRLELHLRKRVIASHLGMAPETFSRALRQLRERGLIEQQGVCMQLVDVRGLQQVAAG